MSFLSSIRILIIVTLVTVGTLESAPVAQRAPAASPSLAAVDPVDGVIEAFRTHAIVALAEAHGLQEEHDFIARLLREPRLSERTQIIVVEWANALYQDVLDRYVNGESIAPGEVAKAWRNTGFSPFAPWDAPVYSRFFAIVREVNSGRPAARRFRILAADPPVDWSNSRAEIEETKQRNPRDAHFFRIIEREVLSKNQKALLIFGGGHLYRHWWNPFSENNAPQNLIDFLEQKAPKTVFVVMAHAFVERNDALENKLKTMTVPAFVGLQGNWLGELSTTDLMDTTAERGFADGTVARARINGYSGLRLRDLADGYMYFGDMDRLTASVISPQFFVTEPEYAQELRRRYALITGGGRLPDTYFTRERSTKFYNGPGR